MWILTVLPNNLIHILLSLSVIGLVAGFALGFIPIIGRYKLPIQLISLILFTFSVYFEGKIAANVEWEIKISELKVKLAEAEIKSEKVNTVVVTKYITKRELIKEKGEDVIQYIDREVVKFDKICPIPEAAIKAHNAAAQNVSAESSDTTSNK